MNEINPIIKEILEEKQSALRQELGNVEVTIARHSFGLYEARVEEAKLQAAITVIDNELRDA